MGKFWVLIPLQLNPMKIRWFLHLNFKILKCFLFLPIRFCLNKIGPLESILIKTIISKYNGDKSSNPIKAPSVS